MPRKPRIHVPNGFYHATVRGNHRRNLFASAADRSMLDRIVATSLETVGAKLHAYCWMTNHLHLLVQVADEPLGALMQRIGTRFARAVQSRIPTTGHLFENRYFARNVENDAYFLDVLRYLHMNPVHARLVARPEDYRWSSHRSYLGLASQPWVSTDFALGLFDRDRERAKRSYAHFVEAPAGQGPAAARGRGEPPPSDLERVAREICASVGIFVADLQSTARSQTLVEARAAFAARALAETPASVDEIARFLRRSRAAVSRARCRAALSSPAGNGYRRRAPSAPMRN